MLIDSHCQMEGCLDVRYRPRDIQVRSIAGRSNHRKTVRFRETDHRVIIRLAGTILRRELFHREESAISCALRIVEFLQEAL